MIRVGSLFTGYGGIELALDEILDEPAVAFVADNDPAAARVIAARFPGVPNLGDLTGVTWTDVEPVDVLTGGTPCQDVSNAGKRGGMVHGSRSNLWVTMREAIAVLRPRLVMWENVRGVLSAAADTDLEHCPRCMGKARADQPRLRAFGRVLGDLVALGYDARWTGLRARDVGAPHNRFRIFLVAYPYDDPPTAWIDAERLERLGGDTPVLGTPASSIYRGSGPVGSASHTARLNRKYLDAQILQIATLPTPAVNDMGEGKTVEWWDAWAPRQRAADGTRAVHGRSLAIEALRLLPTPTRADGAGGPAGHRDGGPNLRTVLADSTQWGKYAPAIARWESILGRPAPPMVRPGPTGAPALSSAFVEWLMGLPAGWVTDVPGLTRNDQIRALGNGVVPRQGAVAYAELLTIGGGRST